MFTWPAASATPSVRLSLAGVCAESFGDRQARHEENLAGRHG